MRVGLFRLSTIAAAAACIAAQDPRPTFRARTDLVSVDVAVTADRKAVPGLASTDFEVTDNGVRQQVEILDAGSLPIDVTVVLDASGSMTRAVADLQNDVRAIAAMLNPADRLRMLTFAADVREVVPLRPAAEAHIDAPVEAHGSTSLFDAVALALLDTSGADRRQLVVVLTDGNDTSSALGRSSLEQLARRSRGVVYAAVADHVAAAATPGRPVYREPLLMRNVAEPRAAAFGDDGPLRAAAEESGGVWDAMMSIGRAPAGVRHAIDWFRAAYVLRYRASGVDPGGWHELSVRVTRPGSYDVRARRGYFGS
jgi:VWFA-related protein